MVLRNADTEYSPRISPKNWLLPVLNNQNTPPATPKDGDRYRVTAVASGLWVGKENTIAIWNKDDSVWIFQPLVEPQIWYDMTSQDWHYMSHTGVITQFDKIPLAISDVTGLQAALDGKAPLIHKTNHLHGGSDAFAVNDVIDATARIQCQKNGISTQNPESLLNFKEGSNIAITVADNPGNGSTDITINAAGGGGTFLDNIFKVENAVDPTKIFAIDASVIPIGTTRTVKPCGADGTMATLENTETFSGVKTYSVAPVFSAGASAADTITSSKNGDVLLPSVDGQGNVGSTTKRFALVRAVAVTTGDLILSDRKTKKILYVIDEDKEGIYFSNYRTGKCLMKLDDRGNLFVSGKITTGYKLSKRNIKQKPKRIS